MLNALVEYAQNNIPLSEPGFTDRMVRWRIELSADGRLLGVLPQGEDDKGQEKWGCPEMHNMNAGGNAHFLVDNLKAAVLYLGRNPTAAELEKARPRHEFYRARISEAAKQVPLLKPLADFLADDAQLATLRETLLNPPHRAKATENQEWRIDGLDPLKDAAVIDWWRSWRRNDLGEPDGKAMACFVTGELAPALLTHPKVSGLPGGQPSGDVVVGFNKAAFQSFGLEKSANAAVSEAAARQYVDALNHLNRRGRHLADSRVLHWYKGTVPIEDDPLAWIPEPESVKAASAAIKARELLAAIRTGQRPDLGNSLYFACTLSGMSGRVMVRDWMEGQFPDLVRATGAWFADLEIVARDGKGRARDPKFMAVCGALVRDLKDLPAPTATTLWRVAVQGLPVPQPLMAQALARFRADLVDKDQPAFNHARMGLIKAYFVRLQPGGDTTMTAYLNPEHPAPAYHCGRLLAVLANLQFAALGDVGAGVVQRYYAAASQTPGLILGRLASNARNHLGKLEPGLAWWYEERIAEVMSRLKDSAPRILDLEGQGLFALGYYQQLAQLRGGNKSTSHVTNSQGAQQ